MSSGEKKFLNRRHLATFPQFLEANLCHALEILVEKMSDPVLDIESVEKERTTDSFCRRALAGVNAQAFQIAQGGFLRNDGKPSLPVHFLNESLHLAVKISESRLCRIARTSGVLAGLAGFALLAVFQKQVEMFPAPEKIPFGPAYPALALRSAGPVGRCPVEPAQFSLKKPPVVGDIQPAGKKTIHG